MLKKTILFFGLLVLALMSIQPAFAETERVEMRVDGMTCPFCVYGIEKKLKGVGGIEDASANLKTGIVDIKVNNGNAVDIKKLNKAVEESGFTPGEIRVTARGSVTEYRGYTALKVTGSGQIFLLVDKGEHGKEESLSKEKMDEIRAATKNGAELITVTGYVHAHSDYPPALSVDSFKVK